MTETEAVLRDIDVTQLALKGEDRASKSREIWLASRN